MDYLPVTVTGKTESIWGKLAYCQFKQVKLVRNKRQILKQYLSSPLSHAQLHSFTPKTFPSSTGKDGEGRKTTLSMQQFSLFISSVLTLFSCSRVGFLTRLQSFWINLLQQTANSCFQHTAAAVSSNRSHPGGPPLPKL